MDKVITISDIKAVLNAVESSQKIEYGENSYTSPPLTGVIEELQKTKYHTENRPTGEPVDINKPGWWNHHDAESLMLLIGIIERLSGIEKRRYILQRQPYLREQWK